MLGACKKSHAFPTTFIPSDTTTQSILLMIFMRRLVESDLVGLRRRVSRMSPSSRASQSASISGSRDILAAASSAAARRLPACPPAGLPACLPARLPVGRHPRLHARPPSCPQNHENSRNLQVSFPRKLQTEKRPERFLVPPSTYGPAHRNLAATSLSEAPIRDARPAAVMCDVVPHRALRSRGVRKKRRVTRGALRETSKA
jgi:hypothetical protein